VSPKRAPCTKFQSWAQIGTPAGTASDPELDPCLAWARFGAHFTQIIVFSVSSIRVKWMPKPGKRLRRQRVMGLATKMTVATSLAVPKQASLYFQPIDWVRKNLAPVTF